MEIKESREELPAIHKKYTTPENDNTIIVAPQVALNFCILLYERAEFYIRKS